MLFYLNLHVLKILKINIKDTNENNNFLNVHVINIVIIAVKRKKCKPKNEINYKNEALNDTIIIINNNNK